MKRDIIVAVLISLIPTIPAYGFGLSDLLDAAMTAAAGAGSSSDSIVAEAVKETEDRVRECTVTGVATMESAPRVAALNAQYESAKAKCTGIGLSNLEYRVGKRLNDAQQAESQACSRSLNCDLNAISDKYNPVFADYRKRKKDIDQKADQQVQVAVKSAESQLLAVYNKRLPDLEASEVAENRRKANEALAREEAINAATVEKTQRAVRVKSEYYDYVLSQTYADPRWRSEIDQCEKASQRPLRIFKNGFLKEIQEASSKKQQESMKSIASQFDDPILLKMACVSNSIVVLFDPGERSQHPLLAAIQQQLPKGLGTVYPQGDEYPTAKLKAYRDDLTDAAMEKKRNDYRAQIASLASMSEQDYPTIKVRFLDLLSWKGDDVSNVSRKEVPGVTVSDVQYLARLQTAPLLFDFNHEIYLKLASSKQYSADAVIPKRVEIATPEPNQEHNPVVTEKKLSAPSHCKADETTVFSCPAGNKVVSYCASPNKAPYKTIEYRYGAIGKVEKTYTADGGGKKQLFGDQVAIDPRAVINVVWFNEGAFSFSLMLCQGGTCNGAKERLGLVVMKGKSLISKKFCQVETEGTELERFPFDFEAGKSQSPVMLPKYLENGAEMKFSDQSVH